MTAMRVEAGVTRSPRVRFRFDGRAVDAHDGETVAAALLASGIRALRRAPVDFGPRGAFCMTGVCQECVVEIDGRRVEACRAMVREGLDVRRVPDGDRDAV